MKHLIPAKPGEIKKIHAHLDAGNQILLKTYAGRGMYLTKKTRDYIQADGNGYRLGWTVKKSVYTFATDVYYVAEGYGF